ncbi:polysaccharide biosynthesis protein [Palleronia abyssalis]|uniref:UDP-N-acetyl-alpha-D-glucosamine C6 dehydratase n=1 Tax=Palleronia abyssalis TaxID=1501240 RepID=A0A2R8BU23_9RHOB|nr:nucleoside-diphosphate sugar epimerase/dehydratase [Palleronia abyssalis]SPJ23669.1 UDP-N-acetyl-alpha-D-glucosamine C6 dehydratase [Palleronia abyssalis]
MANTKYIESESHFPGLGILGMLREGSRRSKAFFAFDLIAANAALLISLMLTTGTSPFTEGIVGQMLLLTAIALVVLPQLTIYRTNLRFASLTDLIALAGASLAIVLTLGVTASTTSVQTLNLRTLVILLLLLSALLTAPRLAMRSEDIRSGLITALGLKKQTSTAQPVLLIGRGTATDLFLRSLRTQPNVTFRPVGIIDDLSGSTGTCIHGIPVLGTYNDCAAVQANLAKRWLRVDRIILTEPLTRQATIALEPLLSWARAEGIMVSQLPGLSALRPLRADGGLGTIDVAELLDRQEARVDYASIQGLVRGRRVMVTGAGGSIGSELVRQIASLKPASIIMIENCELNSYQIDMDLDRHFPGIPRHAYICCIRDKTRLQEIFRRHRPELVFNAAALKHVPIVERNPCEGVLTNVIGASNVADLAAETGALAMIQISTDKAVNTSNVMGATKRVAEMYCQALDRQGGTRFMTVRFGNVLGSSGSLVPLFRKQIDEGGPLTVTDARMTRFFMTIREAVELTLLASASGLQRDLSQGQIMVLDMGKPITIVSLAERMIRLAGMVPGRDIEIRTIGIRPGEKLFEELFDKRETRSKSPVEGILVATTEGLPLNCMHEAIGALAAAARQGHAASVVACLSRIVPGYVPDSLGVSRCAPESTPSPARAVRHDTVLPQTEVEVV